VCKDVRASNLGEGACFTAKGSPPLQVAAAIKEATVLASILVEFVALPLPPEVEERVMELEIELALALEMGFGLELEPELEPELELEFVIDVVTLEFKTKPPGAELGNIGEEVGLRLRSLFAANKGVEIRLPWEVGWVPRG